MVSLGYYFADSRYGQFLDEVGYTNTTFCEAGSGYHGGGLQWPFALRRAVKRARKLGYKVDLNFQDPLFWDQTLARTKSLWSTINWIDIMDEPPLNKFQLDELIQDLRGWIETDGLEQKPIGAVFSRSQMLNGNGFNASGLDWVGIEAYLTRDEWDKAAEGGRGMQYRLLFDTVQDQLVKIKPSKEKLLVLQGYDRNGTWDDISELEILQEMNNELVQDLEGEFDSIRIFSFGRPGGTKEHSSLVPYHIDLAEDLTPV